MKHWLKCLLLATSIFVLPSSAPSLAISASRPSTQTSSLMTTSHGELATQTALRLINRPPSMSRMEQLLLVSFSLGLIALQLRRRHEILIAPRLPV
jgi:hypothetical protein